MGELIFTLFYGGSIVISSIYSWFFINRLLQNKSEIVETNMTDNNIDDTGGNVN